MVQERSSYFTLQFSCEAKTAVHTNMLLLSFLFLAFVCHATSDDLSYLLEFEIYKVTFKYYDKYIYSPYLETENKTCELSIKVIHNMQNMSAPDIWDSLRTVSKQLDKVKTAVEGGDNEGCVQEVRNSWNDFVLQETHNLKQRLQSALIEQEKLQTKVSEVFKNYTLTKKNVSESLKDCRLLSPSDVVSCASEVRSRFQNGELRTLAVTGEITGRDKFLTPCITAFESSVLGHHAERSQRIVEEIGRVRTNLFKCSNQSENSKLAEAIATFEIPAALNSSSSIKLAQKLHDDLHNNIWIALDSFMDVEIKVWSTFSKIYIRPEVIPWKSPRRDYSDYMLAEEKILYYHPDLENSRCSSVRRDIDDIVKNGHEEIDGCLKTYSNIILQNLSEGGEKLKNITRELSEAGNVAILDCINDPYTFQKNRTEECYMLKFRKFDNLWDKVQWELEDLKTKINIYLDDKGALPSSPELCLNFLYQKMLFRASQALYDFRKCLYLETGIEYDVTLPDIPREPFYFKPLSVPSTTVSPATDTPNTKSLHSERVGMYQRRNLIKFNN